MSFTLPYRPRAALLAAALALTIGLGSLHQILAQQSGSRAVPGKNGVAPTASTPQTTSPQPAKQPATGISPPGARMFQATMMREASMQQQAAAREAKASRAPRAAPGKNGVPPQAGTAAQAEILLTDTNWWIAEYQRMLSQQRATSTRAPSGSSSSPGVTIRVETPPAPRKR
jgi:hypothetical protein